MVHGEQSLAEFDRGGLEVMDASLEQFCEALTRESHTVKRALTDPDLFSAIGNAYSDEILHAACLSPVRLTRQMTSEEIERLYAATQSTLREWIDLLREQAGDGFPEKVTAFHKEMAVHGRYGKPCPVCGTPVQRIVHAENESNYCPHVPDGREAVGGSRALAPAERRLAQDDRGARAAEAQRGLGPKPLKTCKNWRVGTD